MNPQCRAFQVMLSSVLVLILGSLTFQVLALNYREVSCRKVIGSLKDYGAIGDGKTLNTKHFQAAISNLSKVAGYGGSLLVVPSGNWLTGSFNLTSHFTLYLEEGAVILASTDKLDYPIIEPLPSYGRGRDAPGPRYAALITGSDLTDVVITGANGTINGQGSIWWENFMAKKLNYTRPYLFELLYSSYIQIFNVTFLNSPSWNIHPYASRYVIIKGVTILAPVDSANTDGIDPDSCDQVLIEDCFVVSGDDVVAIKSGWDQYGIRFGVPSTNIIIRNLVGISPTSALVAIGSELSGGVKNIRAENLHALNTESILRIKTAPGRGAFVEDIFFRNISLNTMKYFLWMTMTYGQHPDNFSNPNNLTYVNNVNMRNVFAQNVTMPAQIAGLEKDSFNGVCLSDVNITNSFAPNSKFWNCSYVKGASYDVVPSPCDELLGDYKMCPEFPSEQMDIEKVKLQDCVL